LAGQRTRCSSPRGEAISWALVSVAKKPGARAFEEITSGRDELGVLSMGHKKGIYWYGAQLDIHETRKLTPYNNATSIQV
jgi:homospermidine synthase